MNRTTTTKAGTSSISDKANVAAPTAARPAVRERQSVQRNRPRVGLYASIVIVMTLLLGAAWELWRWILLIITLD